MLCFIHNFERIHYYLLRYEMIEKGGGSYSYEQKALGSSPFPVALSSCEEPSPPPPHNAMAAPQIPNLNTLRGPRSSGRGRGRGRGALGDEESSPAEAQASKDKIVQQTDHDASVSRMSAVEVGYLNDAFAQHFASARQRRFPIINRGSTSFCCRP